MKARAVEGLDPAGALRPNVARIVATRLDELRCLSKAALVPDASEAQHDLRIAAKRLRYVLELFASCLGGKGAEEAGRAARQLQSTLGDLHDCDLMLGKIEGIGSVEALLRERRERLFREFVTLWQAEAGKGTWAVLESSL
jgi:CHAD domain-containing protein